MSNIFDFEKNHSYYLQCIPKYCLTHIPSLLIDAFQINPPKKSYHDFKRTVPWSYRKRERGECSFAVFAAFAALLLTLQLSS